MLLYAGQKPSTASSSGTRGTQALSPWWVSIERARDEEHGGVLGFTAGRLCVEIAVYLCSQGLAPKACKIGETGPFSRFKHTVVIGSARGIHWCSQIHRSTKSGQNTVARPCGPTAHGLLCGLQGTHLKACANSRPNGRSYLAEQLQKNVIFFYFNRVAFLFIWFGFPGFAAVAIAVEVRIVWRQLSSL